MQPAPLRILHCLRAPVGGLFRHVCDLAEAQAACGHHVGIVADAATGGEAAAHRFEALRSHCSLGITRFAMSRIPGPGDLAVALKINALARQARPDILHGHGAKGGAYARLASYKQDHGDRAARIYTPHGGSLHYSPGTLTGFLYLGAERLLARRTDAFLFESRYSERVFGERVGPPRGLVRVVHNGLRPGEFEPVTPATDAVDFVFVGELRALKGIDTLLLALADLKNDATAGRDGASAVIVGAGADRDLLIEQASSLGLGDRVSFPGRLPARDAFARGHCIVVPSRAESLPYIVLEAAAAGLPIIASDVGGIPEIFADRTDRLIPPGDPGALAAAMRAFLADPAAARSAAAELATVVKQRFSVDTMADAVLAAYAEARTELRGRLR